MSNGSNQYLSTILIIILCRLLCTVLHLFHSKSGNQEDYQPLGSPEIYGNTIIEQNLSMFTLFQGHYTSSGQMEILAAKSLLLNLAWEHNLEIYSLTTDRAKDMKTLMRYDW